MNLKRERPLAMFCTSRVPPRSFLHMVSRLCKIVTTSQLYRIPRSRAD